MFYEDVLMSSLMLKYVWLFEYVCLCHCVRVGERYWRAGLAGHCGGFDGHSNLIQLPFCLYTCAHAACTGSVCLSGRVVCAADADSLSNKRTTNESEVCLKVLAEQHVNRKTSLLFRACVWVKDDVVTAATPFPFPPCSTSHRAGINYEK